MKKARNQLPTVISLYVLAAYFLINATGFKSYLWPWTIISGGGNIFIDYGLLLTALVGALYEILFRSTGKPAIAFSLLIPAFFLLPIAISGFTFSVVEKSYVLGVLSIWVFVSMTGQSAALQVLRFYAVIVAVSAVFCLVDIGFSDGLTTTDGRGAGFFHNPNVAGIALLIGLVACLPAVSQKFRASFLILVCFGIFATLSRTIYASTLLVIASFVLVLIVKGKLKEVLLGAKGYLAALCTFGLCLAWIIYSLTVNPAFSTSMQGHYSGLFSAFDSWVEGRDEIASSKEKESEVPSPTPPSVPREFAASQKPVDESAAPDALREISKTSSQATEKSEKVELGNDALTDSDDQGKQKNGNSSEDKYNVIRKIEKENSAAARVLLLQQAIQVYLEAPWYGIGLDGAFALHPHNGYLEYAIAFGVYGWLVVPMLLLPIAVWRGFWQGIPYYALITSLMMFSHDLLFSTPLVAALVGMYVSAKHFQSVMKHEKPDDTASHFAICTYLSFALALVCLLVGSGYSANNERLRYQVPKDAISVTSEGVFNFKLPRAELQGFRRIDKETLHVFEGEISPTIAIKGDQKRLSKEHLAFYIDGNYVVFSLPDRRNASANGEQYFIEYFEVLHPIGFVVLASLLLVSLTAFSLSGRSKKASGSSL